ncbi:Glucose-repressible alcohol dehydrogenase transcriptional effector protein [Rutstroemia sp. NJR-2017a WRK4]|nr:Glucose-repressible alcohol dehydrogenase transcriptional effector protein [Rutstroemia sp. NJR-2017a WRK4]
MFNHQQGQHGHINGAGRGGLTGLVFNTRHNPQHPQHAQHYGNLQPEQNSHNTNGNVLGHHSNFSSGVLPTATPPFTTSNLQNGHNSATRGGQAQAINEHWAKQLEMHKESENAHMQMTDRPHHFARTKAHFGVVLTASNTAAGGVSTASAEEATDDTTNRNRPSNTDNSIKRQDWHNIDMSGLGLRVLAVELFQYTFLQELYVASNKLTYLPSAIGQLRHLRYLDASHNQLQILPNELGMCVFLKTLLLFDNNLRSLPQSFGSLYQLEMLGIEGNAHMDNAIKSELMEKGTKALIHTLREEAPEPHPPAPRQMVDLLDGAPSTNQERFTVLSYNILCDNYVNPTQYGYVPSKALEWEHRKEEILREIETRDPDFVCLQEVDADNFREFFSVKLAYHDYKGVFWPKSRAKTMSESAAKGVDGCATFYKNNKYILLDKQLIDFANIAINRPDMKNQHDIFNRVMPRDHIAVVAFFENRLTGSRVIVANAHLFWDPAYADVKLIQMAILMESVSKLAEKYQRWPACKDKKAYTITDDTTAETPAPPPPEPAPSMEYTNKTQIPLIVCGDLNSKAGESVYELLDTGRVAPDHDDLKGHQYGNFTRDGIEHPFSLRSAYTNLADTPMELTFTNYTPGFVGHIDHIWYSTNALENTELLGPVDEEYMKNVPGLPHYHFPSDHLALLAEFAVKAPKAKKTHPEPDFGPSSHDRRRD